jgi:hypothetical protein
MSAPAALPAVLPFVNCPHCHSVNVKLIELTDLVSLKFGKEERTFWSAYCTDCKLSDPNCHPSAMQAVNKFLLL